MRKVSLHMLIIVEPCATYHPWPIYKTNLICLFCHLSYQTYRTTFIYTLETIAFIVYTQPYISDYTIRTWFSRRNYLLYTTLLLYFYTNIPCLYTLHIHHGTDRLYRLLMIIIKTCIHFVISETPSAFCVIIFFDSLYCYGIQKSSSLKLFYLLLGIQSVRAFG